MLHSSLSDTDSVLFLASPVFADDGTGADTTYSVTTDPTCGLTYVSTAKNINRSYIVTVALAGGKGTYTTPNLTGGYRLTILPIDQYEAQSDIDAYAVPDPRSVGITGPATTFKQAMVTNDGILYDSDGDDMVVMPPPVHQPDANGTMYGDIGLPDYFGARSGSGRSQTPVSYTADLCGIWTLPGLSYSWSDSLSSMSCAGGWIDPGKVIPNPIIAPATSMYQGALAKRDGSTDYAGYTGETARVSISVIDGADGVKAVGKCYMKIHRECEVLPSMKTEPIDSVTHLPKRLYKELPIIKYRSNPEYPTEVTNVCSFDVDVPGFAWGDSETDLHIIETVEDLLNLPEEVKMVINLASPSLVDMLPKPATWEADFNEMWGMALNSHGPGMPVSNYTINGARYTDYGAKEVFIDGYKAYFSMVPHAIGAFNPTWHLADQYDLTGFKCETKFHTDDPVSDHGYNYGEFSIAPTK